MINQEEVLAEIIEKWRPRMKDHLFNQSELSEFVQECVNSGLDLFFVYTKLNKLIEEQYEE